MSKKLLGVIIGIISLLAIVGIVYATAPEQSPPPTANKSTTDVTSEPNINPQAPVTKAEVAKHNNEDDCWTIIDGNVYDITSYIPRHPGGDEILRACGNDGSSLFNERTTEEGEVVGSGTAHSSSAKSTLSRFQVGVLTD